MADLPDFDTMMKLAKENPEALERLRLEATETVVKHAPEEYRRRLRGLQFNINMEVRKAKTPQAACLRISQMMHDSFSQLRDHLNSFGDIQDWQDEDSQDTADILPFRARN